MYIEMKKCVDVPYGFYCEGCNAIGKETDLQKKETGILYCEVNGERIAKTKDGKLIKTNTCFAAIRNHLRNG